jgi:hypothetical protein
MRNSKSLLALSLIAMMFLSGCATRGSETSVCPPWPVGGPKVAEELENIPYHGYEDFWSWMDRLAKLRDQLEACR